MHVFIVMANEHKEFQLESKVTAPAGNAILLTNPASKNFSNLFNRYANNIKIGFRTPFFTLTALLTHPEENTG